MIPALWDADVTVTVASIRTRVIQKECARVLQPLG